MQYVTIHGYRRAYVKAGSGPALLLIHGIGDSSDIVAARRRATGRALHRHRPGPARARALREAAGRLLGGGVRQRDARPAERARGRPGHRRRALAGRRGGGAVRLPVPRRCERLVLVGSGGVGRTVSPLLRMAAVPGIEALMPLLGPPARSVRQPPRRRAVARSSTPRSGATPRRSWRSSTRCPTRRPAW